MRQGRDLWVLVTLTILFIIFGSVVGRQATHEQAKIFPTRSTYSSGPNGTKAAFLLLEQLGFRAVRSRSSLSSIPPGAKIIFIIDPLPMMLFTGREIAALDEWVWKGGTLICFNGYPRLFPALEDVDVKQIEYQESVYEPRHKIGYFSNIRKLKTSSAVRITEISETLGYKTLMKDEKGILAAVKPQGKGRIIVIADPSLITNAGIGRSDNAVFIANLATLNARKGETIVFDEYHQGYGEKRSVAHLLGKYGRMAAVLLAMALIFALYSVGRRFGAVRPAEKPSVRVNYEYIEAMGRLYQRAGASSAAAEILCREFQKKLAKELQIPESAGIDALAEAASKAWHKNSGEVRQLLKRCSLVAGGEKISDAEIVRLVSDMKHFQKEAGFVRHY